MFLLNSPLFLYTISPRVRSAESYLHKPKLRGTVVPARCTIEPHCLGIVTTIDHDGCFTQLRYGTSVLIDVREPARAPGQNTDQQRIREKSIQWFCEEIEFLGNEYRAREQAAAEILGRQHVKSTKSKVVKLKMSNRGVAASKFREYRGTLEGTKRRLEAGFAERYD